VSRKIIKQLFVLIILVQLAPVSAALDTTRQAELLYLLKHDCGSCHGMTRKGGLGPPLLPENLGGRPQLLFVDTILDGRSGTPMPPWYTHASVARFADRARGAVAGRGHA